MEFLQLSLPSLFSGLKVIKCIYFLHWLYNATCCLGWSLSKREPEPDYPSDEEIAEYLAMLRDGYRGPGYPGEQ